MAVVWLVQDRCGRDFSDAWNYGDVKTLLPPDKSLVHNTREARKLIRENLRGFSDDDYIVAVGDIALIAQTCVIAAQLNLGRVKVLHWDSKEHKYLMTQIDER